MILKRLYSLETLFSINNSEITKFFSCAFCRSCYSSHSQGKTMRNILNVAEKNDAAKNISAIMSRGTARRRDGLSVYNKIYEFDYNFRGQNCNMIMTSVSGHLLQKEFIAAYKNWQSCSPLSLFEAPVIKNCNEDYLPIKATLEREIRRCDTLIIWTDCDREGENIGFEIIDVCTAINRNLQIYRAKFSQITATAINQAMARLVQPNKNVSDAVDVRSELDLRIGASFTRFQTLRLQKLFPRALANELISYGSCQFPTMGFVIERFKDIQEFITEAFWKIDVTHRIDEVAVQFNWSEVHLFDQIAVQIIFDKCQENPVATVEKVESRPKSKWRPLPLDTVELEKLASRKLRITAAEAMRVAESLYTNGLISYPRTETNIFPQDLALRPLIEMQINDPNWGEFAQRVLEDGPNPRQGKKTDQAHPPIHPTKYANNLNGNQQRLYELIVRHFLACCSKDAKGHETKVRIDIAQEKFNASGLMILERNYLDVYIYDKWSDSEIHVYEVGQQFVPTTLEMKTGETSPPNLLTEADLIALMEKHGIGTDATHAEHIETIKKRNYVALHDNQYFVPCQLGIALAEGYDNMGFNMSKPYLRAELESDLKQICEGTKVPQTVLQDQIRKYRDVFVIATQQAAKIDAAVEQYLHEERQANVNVTLPADTIMQRVRPCPHCGQDMVLRQRRNSEGYFVSCSSYPACRFAQWFPTSVKEVVVTEEICQRCPPQSKKLRFKFQRGVFDVYYPDPYHVACVGGCDQEFISNIGIRTSDVNQNGGNLNRAARGSNRNTGNTNGLRGNTWGESNPSEQNRRDSSDSGYDSLGTPSQPLHQGRGLLRADRGRGAASQRGLNKENRQIGTFSQFPQQRNFTLHPTQPRDPNDGAPYCQCSELGVIRIVRKEGVNKGRQFYTCHKPIGQGCGFFLWADEETADREQSVPAPTWGGNTNRRTNNTNQSGGIRRAGTGIRNRGPTARGATRKCGSCGEAGHTRRSCRESIDE